MVRRVIKAFPTLIQAVALVALLHLLGQVATLVFLIFMVPSATVSKKTLYSNLQCKMGQNFFNV